MRCKKCGNIISNKNAKYCKKCGHRLEKGYFNKTSFLKILKKTGLIIAIVLPVIILLLYASSTIAANISCSRLAEYIEHGDDNSISLVSTRRDVDAYLLMEKLMSMEDPTKYKHETGILAEIYKNSKVEQSFVLPGITKAKVKMKIDAPDMYKFIMDNKDKKISKEKLQKMIVDYAASGSSPRKTSEIDLNMELTKHGWLIDFENAHFMDAVSGGFLSAYGELVYEPLIKEAD